jgi:hypothetical protein
LTKKVLLKFLSKVQEEFGFYHKKLTHLEGGLGSQILGMISFYNQQDRYGYNAARCDLSYFNHQDRADLWEWNLHNFGIELEELRKFESRSKLSLLKAKRDFVTDLEITQEYWKNSRAKYLNRFPLDELKLQIFLQKVAKKSNLQNYGAIHIRRGDYLKVASKVIGLDEYVAFLKNIRNILPNLSFIITDSALTPEEKQELSEAVGIGCEVVFLDGPGHDPFILHCLMRNSQLLVTANSTFSFSAGLLGKQGQVVFSPLEFHGGKGSEKYNRTFRSVGSFTSWNLDNSRGTI